jgi:cytoskeletal protein CcmA (bactofilin family)
MFSKTAKTPDPMPSSTADPTPTPASPTPAPAPARPIETAPPSTQAQNKPKVATLIAENMTVEGGVTGDGELHVDGVVRGDLRVSRLTIGETGRVEGSVVCDAIEIRGKVVGTVTSKQVRLYASAYVDGDITHEQLAMEIGAFFQGRSLKFQRPAGGQPAAAPAQSQTSPSPSSAAGKETSPTASAPKVMN